MAHADEFFAARAKTKQFSSDIPLGESQGGLVSLGGTTPLGIITPASWGAHSISFLVSHDGVTFVPLHSSAGEVVLADVPASTGVSLDAVLFAGWPYVRARAGVAATPVAVASEQSLIILARGV